MKTEYDFNKGERGKFFRPDAELRLPIYLDSDVQLLPRRTSSTEGHIAARNDEPPAEAADPVDRRSKKASSGKFVGDGERQQGAEKLSRGAVGFL